MKKSSSLPKWRFGWQISHIQPVGLSSLTYTTYGVNNPHASNFLAPTHVYVYNPFFCCMVQDIASKQELFRMTSTKWRGINSRNRWELMCAMHDQGESWAGMGRQINRHWTTAKRLWKRGMLERQRKHAKRHTSCPVYAKRLESENSER